MIYENRFLSHLEVQILESVINLKGVSQYQLVHHSMDLIMLDGLNKRIRKNKLVGIPFLRKILSKVIIN